MLLLAIIRDDELTVQSVKVTQSGMNGKNTTEFTSENNEIKYKLLQKNN